MFNIAMLEVLYPWSFIKLNENLLFTFWLIVLDMFKMNKLTTVTFARLWLVFYMKQEHY